MKTCRKCGVLFNTRHCKVCAADYSRRKNAEKSKIVKVKNKNCRKCGGVLEKFVCKACANEAKAKYRSENKEKIKKQSAAYYIKNKDRIDAANKQWALGNMDKRTEHYQSNKEKIKIRDKEYREKNITKIKAKKAQWRSENVSKIKAKSRAYRLANPDALRILDQNRRAREKAAIGNLSRGLAKKLLILQKGKCACCGKDLRNNYHLDHIMPLALGGSNADDNIQLLLPRCNQQKKARHPIEFMQSRGFLI